MNTSKPRGLHIDMEILLNHAQCTGDRENHVEGTRQDTYLTLGKGGPSLLNRNNKECMLQCGSVGCDSRWGRQARQQNAHPCKHRDNEEVNQERAHQCNARLYAHVTKCALLLLCLVSCYGSAVQQASPCHTSHNQLCSDALTRQ